MKDPIDMVLHCPKCHLQHIDETTSACHRSHLCHGCGHIWRPADVPTNGVAAVKTRGSFDSPIASRIDNVRDAGPSAFGGRNAGLRREHSAPYGNALGNCPVCRAAVRDSFGGLVCENGHGGVDPIPPEAGVFVAPDPEPHA